MGPAATPVTQAWLDQALNNIRQEQLEIQVLPDFSLRAVSIGVDFETFFDGGGVEVSRRHQYDGAWNLRWEFVEAKFDGLTVAEEAEVLPAAFGKQVLFHRTDMLELYENTESGVEQKFVFDRPPTGASTQRGTLVRADGTLVIQGRFITALTPRRVAGRGIVFSENSQDRVVYTEPVVFDAAGRKAPAELSMRLSPDGDEWLSEIRVAADWLEGASYPVVIDPILTGPAWTLQPTGLGYSFSQFATSVSTAGDVDGNGLADVIVGAPHYDYGMTDAGRVYVYYASSSGLSATANWFADGRTPSGQFGWSVATAGDVNCDSYSDILVGAPDYTNGQTAEGAAFVYYSTGTGGLPTAPGTGTQPSPAPSWTAEGNDSSSGGAVDFGQSVATAGDVNGDGSSDVVVGASGYRNPPMTGGAQGAAFVYYGSCGGGLPTVWSGMGPSPNPSWFAYSDSNSSRLGASVSTAGDVNGDGYADLIVGAYNYTFPPNLDAEGRVLVWHGSPGGLPGPLPAGPSNANWTARSNQLNSLFGRGVSTAGDVNGDGYADVLIGASTYDDGQLNEGKAFVYHGSTNGLSNNAESDLTKPNPRPDWTAQIDEAGAGFGTAVSTAGDVGGDGYADVIVGAPAYGINDPGGAFVYGGSATGLGAAPFTLTPSPPSSYYGSGFGTSVSTAGDVDADGYSDVIVGAPQAYSQDGRALVYRGTRTGGLSTSSNWNANGGAAGAYFGTSAATAGDVNGDGYSDVIVGAPSFDNGEIDEGIVRVFFGSATGLLLTHWFAQSNQAGALFGSSVSSAGDVDGDGYSDVVIGAPTWSNGPATNAGRVFVWYGSAAGFSSGAPPADWEAGSDQSCGHFGLSVATAGDVNGDGFSDLIVGAPNDLGGTGSGRAFVFNGSLGGLPDCTGLALDQCAQWATTGDTAAHEYGASVASAGDVNGDGYSDVIVGEPKCGPDTHSGRALVFHGASDLDLGLSESPAWVCSGRSPQDDAEFGRSVSSAGDVNGDGYSDVIVGAAGFDGPGAFNGGRVDVWHGSFMVGLPTLPASTDCDTSPSSGWFREGDQDYAAFGYSVATLGDVTGDGFSDVIIGAPEYNGTYGDEGRASAWFGGSAGLGSSPTPDWSVLGGQAGALCGWSVSSAGDVSGDGYADALVSSRAWTGAWSGYGRVDMYYGFGNRGLSVVPQQVRADGSALVQLLGSSRSQTQVNLRLKTARSWMGSLRAKVQWEVRPIGTAFTGPVGCGAACGVSGAWIPIGTSGAQVQGLVTGLTANRAYHWRLRVLGFPNITGPWYSIGPNAASETDFRTAP